MVQQIANDNAIPTKNNILILPNIQILWTPESVWDTGIVTSYTNSIYGLAVERFVEIFGHAFVNAHLSPSDIRLIIVPLYIPPSELR